jgi:hypothetical protein
MTQFRSKVLRFVAGAEHTGAVEVAIQLYGDPSPLQLANVVSAVGWLAAHGYVDQHTFTVTERGRSAIAQEAP